MTRSIQLFQILATALIIQTSARASDIDTVRSACNALSGNRKTECVAALSRLAPGPSSTSRTAGKVGVAEIERAKTMITAMLNDPDSARFTSVDISQSTKAVCGLVNAKNAMGGYGQPKRFFVTSELARIEEAETWKFDPRWIEYCPEF